MPYTYPKLYNFINKTIKNEITYCKNFWVDKAEILKLDLTTNGLVDNLANVMVVNPKKINWLRDREYLRFFLKKEFVEDVIKNRSELYITEEVIIFKFSGDVLIILDKYTFNKSGEVEVNLNLKYKRGSQNVGSFDSLFFNLNKIKLVELSAYLVEYGNLDKVIQINPRLYANYINQPNFLTI
jgi:hypothetical protein